MLERNKSRKNYYSINEIIKETRETNGTGEPSAREVLRHLLGDLDGWYKSDYVVYKYNSAKKRTLLQRVNLIWVYPLFVISIPFQYILTGTYGVKRTSRIGKIIDWLVRL